MPVCGLSPAAIESGVPASAPGVVVRTDACNDPTAFDALTVRDASGAQVAFDVIELPDGTLLIRFPGGLTPGRYSIDVEPPTDDDAGVEADASVATVRPDAGVLEASDTVEVAMEAPKPTRFGTVERAANSCDAVITFTPDAAVLPFLPVLAIDLQIDDQPVLPFVLPGALPVKDGQARIAFPTDRVKAAGLGAHQLKLVVRIAGESAPLDTFFLTVQEPCGYRHSDAAPSAGYEREDGPCTVNAVGVAMGSPAHGVLIAGVALYALRRRRRRKRA
jgi:hypothetical protein